MALPSPLPLVSGLSTSQSSDRNVVCGDGKEDFSDADGLLDPSPTFKAMMDLVYQTYPEAREQAPPLSPGLAAWGSSGLHSFEAGTTHQCLVTSLWGLGPCQQVHQALICQVPNPTVL